MSRAILLTRIHAINWYGYHDSLDVEGHLLIAGLTGSGKSVLMDLVQLVLVGTDRALFNRSATGTTSDRTLKSYVLADTKREENGQAQYVRDKGAIAYVALEFTWPSKDRVETWGLRLEFRSALENQGRVTPFWCDGRLEKTDLLDAARRPLELAVFRQFIESQRDGRLFETQEQYLRDMANDSHLNFNRNVLAALLPTSMSFTNLKSFDEFCRRFILPGDSLNITDVVASYKNFQAYERDLRELRDQLDRLEAISNLYSRHAAANRDRIVARWLAAQLASEHTSAQVIALESQRARLRLELVGEEARVTLLDGWILRRRTEIKQAQAVIFQMPGGADYMALRLRLLTVSDEIARLKAIGGTLESALQARLKNARGWMVRGAEASLASATLLESLLKAVEQLESTPLNEAGNALRSLAEAMETVKAEINRAARPLRERAEAVRVEGGRLQAEIIMLEQGIPPGPQRLLNALNEVLPREGREPCARQLRELCEVSDERWRAAVEVVFTRKFAVVVPAEHYDRALKVCQETRGDSPEESLIHPERALRLPAVVEAGSLAEKLSVESPVARRVVGQLFGRIMCVEKSEDLVGHDAAILPDGFMLDGVFAGRRQHYNNLPFVGKRGLEQQLAIKRDLARDLDAEDRRLRPALESVERLLRDAAVCFPEHTSLLMDIASARDLPAREKERDEYVTALAAIDRLGFEEKERELHRIEEELEVWEREWKELLGSQKRGEMERLEALLAHTSSLAERQSDRFEKVRLESCDMADHTTRLNAWRDEIVASHPQLELAAERFEKLEADAREESARLWEKLVNSRHELALAYQKFDDLSKALPSNEPWEKLRTQIAAANIPDYQAKAGASRKQWEGLFRTQVLSKLDRAQRDLRNLIVLLNGNLRSPIGNDRYEIEAKPSPEFKMYRDLISLNAIGGQDDLFFASVDGELRAALDRFLNILVEQPDSLEAARLLDYRHYFDYDLLVWDARDAQAKSVSVDKQSGKFSGGENQSPYFVAILASYLRAYNRHETRWGDPSLALVPIDEAFSKLSPERIEDCVRALKQLDLQGVLSMSAGNIPFAFSQCDQVIIVSKHEDRLGSKSRIRNVPVCLLRNSEEGRDWMKQHA